MFPWLNLVWKVNVLVSLRFLWPRPIDISSLFSFQFCKDPHCVVGLSKFCFEIYDVARLMKCWYSELVLSKRSVIQGSVNISDMLVISARNAVHVLIILVVCYLIHSLDSTHVAFFCYKVSFARFSLQFIWVPSFLESISCKLSGASLLKRVVESLIHVAGWATSWAFLQLTRLTTHLYILYM